VFALAHNHPTGDPTPSDADIEATLRVEEAAIALGLRFLDHIVFTDHTWRRVPTLSNAEQC
jgi:DNA repair protein RadC